MTSLENKINELKRVRIEKKKITDEEKKLSSEVKELMEKEQLEDFGTEEGVTAKLNIVTNLVFDEETFIEDFDTLVAESYIANGLKDDIIVMKPSVDMEQINEALLMGDIDSEKLAHYQTKKEVKRLTIK